MACKEKCIDCAKCVENEDINSDAEFICSVDGEEIDDAERTIDSFTEDGEPCADYEEE